jgi:ATP-dependent exoDNAse (exonuclease V) alpha subunit
MTKGEAGTRNLNIVLQQLINPPRRDKAEIVRGGMTLRVGDRVIQKKGTGLLIDDGGKAPLCQEFMH